MIGKTSLKSFHNKKTPSYNSVYAQKIPFNNYLKGTILKSKGV